MFPLGNNQVFFSQCSEKINLPIQAIQISESKQDYRPSASAYKLRSEEIMSIIAKYALKYEVSYNELFLTIKCESDFSQSARGKAGEIGIAQFMPATWNYFSDLFGFAGNINNADNQIELMAIAFKNNLKYHWTCYKNLKK